MLASASVAFDDIIRIDELDASDFRCVALLLH